MAKSATKKNPSNPAPRPMKHTLCYHAALRAVEPSANEPTFQQMSELEMLECLYQDEIGDKCDEQDSMSYNNIAYWVFNYKLKGPFRTRSTSTHWHGEDIRHISPQLTRFTNYWGDDCRRIDDDFDLPSPRSSREFDSYYDGLAQAGSDDQHVTDHQRDWGRDDLGDPVSNNHRSISSWDDHMSDLEELSRQAAADEQETWDKIDGVGNYAEEWAGAGLYELLDEDMGSPAWRAKISFYANEDNYDRAQLDSHGQRGRTPKLRRHTAMNVRKMKGRF